MTNHIKHIAASLAVATAVAVVGGCNNFLTGGETSKDPNRQIVATNDQYFVATQENLWAFWGSDPARLAGILTQQFHGLANQYGALDATYSHDENTTNGTHAALYTTGGLVDIKKLQTGARLVGDSLYVGIAQVEEGALMGTGADLFGDLVYKQALQGIANPALDDQFFVYDSVQQVVSAGIANINSSARGQRRTRRRGSGLCWRSRPLDRDGPHPQGPFLHAHGRSERGRCLCFGIGRSAAGDFERRWELFRCIHGNRIRNEFLFPVPWTGWARR